MHAPHAFDTFATSRGMQSSLIGEALHKHLATANAEAQAASARLQRAGEDVANRLSRDGGLAQAGQHFAEYLRDAAERSVLTLDVLRKRGDAMIAHEAAGQPPVLIYDYEIVMDGAHLPHPCNYMLLHILPPAGVEVFPWKRPYVIIDPRAGHGSGIGGFKQDSQVGVALADGHPVYFVAFHPRPVPGQTLADITRAEASFLREVIRRHPDAPHPVVVGNCQGGWATAILAATNPDLVGPIVLNGAPMSYWSGRLGQDPMRFMGGTTGGVLPVLLMSDLNGGIFDGANLVQNFESLNPGRTWFRKYFDLYSDVDSGEASFLNFEKWWSGFVLLNGTEIRWIVENLFVGNRLGKNEARLEPGRPIDLKAIRAPVIVFASHGDNITPPQQALNWIVDTYADETEIAIRGQRIIYMIHEEVGHLGIFVSSSVARREHTQVASTLKTIEALSPGLYEMVIEDCIGEGNAKQFHVSFQKRRTSDILGEDDKRREEPAFAAVARMSEMLANAYELTARPAVQAMAAGSASDLRRNLHPMRAQRLAFASANPAMAVVTRSAERVRAVRNPAAPDNPFILAEKLWADMVETGWNAVRTAHAMALELTFLSLYSTPYAIWFGAPNAHSRTLKAPADLRNLPEAQQALARIDRGHLPEAIVRILILLADTRSNVRQDRLQRASEVLNQRAPFDKLTPAARAGLIHEQTLICHFEPQRALAALPHLVLHQADRKTAMEIAEYIVGVRDEMEPGTIERLDDIRARFGLSAVPVAQTAAE